MAHTPNYRINPITDVCRAVVSLNSLGIQAALNQFATGNRSEVYALVQRQRELEQQASKPTVAPEPDIFSTLVRPS